VGDFDNLRCRYPLPDPELQTAEFQTKDLACDLQSYTITETGRLIHHAGDWEVTPVNERPFPDHPEPVYRFLGSWRKRPGSERDVDLAYEGEVRFYTTAATLPGTVTWYEYRAVFVGGTLTSLTRVVEGDDDDEYE
jgi:hypothetical protein